MKNAAQEFGLTCPVLKVSQKHSADYGECLMLADKVIHDRMPPEDLMTITDECGKDILRVAKYFIAIRTGLVEF